MPWVAAFVSFVATWDLQDRSLLWALAIVALPNAVLGTIDDVRPLRASLKFGVQFGVAAVLVAVGRGANTLEIFDGIGVAWPWLVATISMFWIVWCTNTFNFMDGMDAIAAGSGIVFFATYAVLFARVDGAQHLPILAACGGALAGFLVLNFPPARIFMGDGGSLFVGSALAVVVVSLTRLGAPITVAVLPMLTFLWDTTYTLLMRMVRGEPWYRAHCRHLYQRLTLMGVSQWRTRTLYFALAAVNGALSISLLDASANTQALVFGAALVPLVILTVYVELRSPPATT